MVCPLRDTLGEKNTYSNEIVDVVAISVKAKKNQLSTLCDGDQLHPDISMVVASQLMLTYISNYLQRAIIHNRDRLTGTLLGGSLKKQEKLLVLHIQHGIKDYGFLFFLMCYGLESYWQMYVGRGLCGFRCTSCIADLVQQTTCMHDWQPSQVCTISFLPFAFLLLFVLSVVFGNIYSLLNWQVDARYQSHGIQIY